MNSDSAAAKESSHLHLEGVGCLGRAGGVLAGRPSGRARVRAQTEQVIKGEVRGGLQGRRCSSYSARRRAPGVAPRIVLLRGAVFSAHRSAVR